MSEWRHGGFGRTTWRNACRIHPFGGHVGSAAEILKGQVVAAGALIANSTVTLWAACAGAPQATGATGNEGRFCTWSPRVGIPWINKTGGNNPAIALMTALGTKLQSAVKFITTNSRPSPSAFTAARFIKGEAISGYLRVAAGNVPNLVDHTTAGGAPEALSIDCEGPKGLPFRAGPHALTADRSGQKAIRLAASPTLKEGG